MNYKTSGGHRTFGGVKFISWKTGIMQFTLISEDDRCRIGRNYNRTTYFASVDQVTIGRRYQTKQAAIKAAFDKAYGPHQ